MPHSDEHATAHAPSPRSNLPGGLYIIASPIGNLGDISRRACETLAQMDVLACEDTRTTQHLLQALGLRGAELVAYHEHNGAEMRPRLLRRLHEGARVGVVSEAGTPLISDPGFKLVAEACAAGIPVVPIPGACAPIAALMAAGLPTDQFHFAGFVPTKEGARGSFLDGLANIAGTLVLFESPRRLDDTMPALAKHLGADRQGCVARELTKHFEEFRRGTLGELAAHYATAPAPKGEVVIVVGPATVPKHEGFEPTEDWEALAESALRGGMPASQLAGLIAAQTLAPRKEVYAWVQACKDRAAND
jgi:16S rRNA (cytidine1402-2'-O)-methyltransferase